jgi:hypothetical protein
MKNLQLPSYRKFILGLLVLWFIASPVAAFQQDSAGEGAGFTCSASFGSCTCDGTYEHCNAMEKNCKDQKIACTKINDQRICTCFMATKIKPLSKLPTLKPLNANQ